MKRTLLVIGVLFWLSGCGVSVWAAYFAGVRQPLFMGYNYQDWLHQDGTVSVAAMRTTFDQPGTSVDRKQQVAFPKAGHHVIASQLTSGDVPGVYQATERFLIEQAGLKPVN